MWGCSKRIGFISQFSGRKREPNPLYRDMAFVSMELSRPKPDLDREHPTFLYSVR